MKTLPTIVARTKALKSVIEKHELSFESFIILLTLTEKAQSTPKVLEKTGLSRSTVTQILRRFESQGIIIYGVDSKAVPRGLPTRNARLTEKGKDLQKQIQESF